MCRFYEFTLCRFTGAGLSSFREEFEQQIGLPVIDPVEAACWQLHTLVEIGLTTSPAGMFAKPAPKRLTSLSSVLVPRWRIG